MVSSINEDLKEIEPGHNNLRNEDVEKMVNEISQEIMKDEIILFVKQLDNNAIITFLYNYIFKFVKKLVQ
jgi:hypothetical protein|nr:hypothetical protein [Clostridioides sp.]